MLLSKHNEGIHKRIPYSTSRDLPESATVSYLESLLLEVCCCEALYEKTKRVSKRSLSHVASTLKEDTYSWPSTAFSTSLISSPKPILSVLFVEEVCETK